MFLLGRVIMSLFLLQLFKATTAIISICFQDIHYNIKHLIAILIVVGGHNNFLLNSDTCS